MQKFKIAVAQNRFDSKLKSEEYSWEQFLNRIGNPTITAETYEQFKSMSDEQKNNLKDVGGFIAGETKGGKTSKDIINRCMITLDADHIEPRTDRKYIKKIRDPNMCICSLFN